MDRPYDSIPAQGRHQGDASGEEPSTSVRAQPAPHPPGEEPTTPFARFDVSYDEAGGVYRIRSRHGEAAGEPEAPEAPFTRVGTYDRIDEAAQQLPEYARFVVFENPDTGEVYYDKQGNVTNWMPGEPYVQVRIFKDEHAAAAYADARQRAHE